MALHHDILPWLKPTEMLAWYAKNPLLLDAYPARCAECAADLQAGRLDQFRASTIARGMSQERTRLRVKLGRGYEGQASEHEEWLRIEELLQASQIERAERSTVKAFATRCHASEWPWLIARLEEVLTRRADAEQAELLQAA